MGEITINSRVLVGSVFALYFLTCVANGLNDLDILKKDSACDFSCGNSEAQENHNRIQIQELDKVIEGLKKQFKSSVDKFQLLRNKVHALEKDICPDENIWLLESLFRGKKGKPGVVGEQGGKGDQGAKGDQGPKGDQDPKGEQGANVVDVSLDDGSKIYGPLNENELLPSDNSIISTTPPPKVEIYPYGNGNTTSLQVLRDYETEGGVWTVIQRRSTGPAEEFNRSWTEYHNGFGSLDKNFWLGLENVRALTNDGDQELRIDLEGFEGKTGYTKYSNFSVSDASDSYRLSVSGFSRDSTAGDLLTNSAQSFYLEANGVGFSSFDYCPVTFMAWECSHLSARTYGGGWWFTSTWSNLNGIYREKDEKVEFLRGIHWYAFSPNLTSSLAKTEMKIRTRK